MQNREHQNITNSDCRSGWATDEKKALAAVAFPLIEMQKQYGRKMDPKLVMQGWEIKFAGRFTIEQILYALDRYTDEHSDFPAPSDIVNILEPKEPEITTAQYIAAQDYQKRNNYPMFSEAKDIIDLYEKQQGEKRENFTVQCDEIKKLAAASVNRINALTDQSRGEDG